MEEYSIESRYTMVYWHMHRDLNMACKGAAVAAAARAPKSCDESGNQPHSASN